MENAQVVMSVYKSQVTTFITGINDRETETSVADISANFNKKKFQKTKTVLSMDLLE